MAIPTTALRGTIAHLTGAPELEDAEGALEIIEDGVIAMDDHGVITACGPFDEASLPTSITLIDRRGRWILPGFVDTHLHFPQVWCTDAFGGGPLLSWLERCVFPMEAQLADPRLSRRAAQDFTRCLARAGTSTALIFGSQFPSAQAELWQALDRRGLRAICGRTTMTEGPQALTTSLEEAIRLTAEELTAWHRDPSGADRPLLGGAIIPRFSLSLTREGLLALGELHAEWRERGVWFTTHLSENDDPVDGEITQVRNHFGVRHYLDTYDGRFGSQAQRQGPSFLGRKSIFAHAVHCHDDELARLADHGCGVAHCPVSQQFLGSGLMPLSRVRAAGVEVGLGSDIGAGDRYCIAEVANSAFKVHMNGPERRALGPGQLLFLATMGGARVLDLEGRIGNFEVGKEADLVVIDPARHEPLAARLALAGARPPEQLFSLLMATTPALIEELRVQGRTVPRD